MRVTSKGQVTIPLEIRRRMGIGAHAEVEFVIERDTVILRPLKGAATKGRQVVEALRGRASVKMTTDEIMALTRGEE